MELLVILGVVGLVLYIFFPRSRQPKNDLNRTYPRFRSPAITSVDPTPTVHNVPQQSSGLVEGIIIGELLSQPTSELTYVPVETLAPVETFEGQDGEFSGGGANSSWDSSDSTPDSSSDFSSSDSGGSDFGGGSDF